MCYNRHRCSSNAGQPRRRMGSGPATAAELVRAQLPFDCTMSKRFKSPEGGAPPTRRQAVTPSDKKQSAKGASTKTTLFSFFAKSNSDDKSEVIEPDHEQTVLSTLTDVSASVPKKRKTDADPALSSKKTDLIVDDLENPNSVGGPEVSLLEGLQP